MEYLKSVAGIFVVHIPYRGTGPQMQDMLGGRTEVAMVGAPGMLPHVRSNKLRALAIGATERMKTLPDVPTVAESGYPGFETSQWYGVLVPAGTPRPIIDRMAAEIGKALRSSAVTQRFAADDAVAGSGTPEWFAAFIRAEQKRWETVVKKAPTSSSSDAHRRGARSCADRAPSVRRSRSECASAAAGLAPLGAAPIELELQRLAAARGPVAMPQSPSSSSGAALAARCAPTLVAVAAATGLTNTSVRFARSVFVVWTKAATVRSPLDANPM